MVFPLAKRKNSHGGISIDSDFLGSRKTSCRGLTMSRCRSQACIITFMGPAGVGKSTHIRLLRDHLRLNGIRVVTTFIKSSHVLAYILMRSLIAPRTYEKTSYSGRFTRIYSRREVIKRLLPLWCFLDALSIAAKFFFTVYLPFCLGFTILIEEGLIMTLFSYNVSFPHFFDTQPTVPPLVSSLLEYVTSKNHLNIVLNASVEELDRRRRHRSYRQNELNEYIAMQKKWIKQLNFGNTIFIDTTEKPIAKVHKNVLAALEKNKCTRT